MMKTLTLSITVVALNLQFDYKVPVQMKICDLIELCLEIIGKNYDLSFSTRASELRLISLSQQCVLAPQETVLKNGLSNNDRLILL